jgi:hypothetical protein
MRISMQDAIEQLPLGGFSMRTISKIIFNASTREWLRPEEIYTFFTEELDEIVS